MHTLKNRLRIEGAAGNQEDALSRGACYLVAEKDVDENPGAVTTFVP